MDNHKKEGNLFSMWTQIYPVTFSYIYSSVLDVVVVLNHIEFPIYYGLLS